jgi:hypothetical protein
VYSLAPHHARLYLFNRTISDIPYTAVSPGLITSAPSSPSHSRLLLLGSTLAFATHFAQFCRTTENHLTQERTARVLFLSPSPLSTVCTRISPEYHPRQAGQTLHHDLSLGHIRRCEEQPSNLLVHAYPDRNSYHHPALLYHPSRTLIPQPPEASYKHGSGKR